MKTQTLTLDVMLALIRFDEHDKTRLDLDAWIQEIPNELRPLVEDALLEHYDEIQQFRGKPATDPQRQAIVSQFHMWVNTDERIQQWNANE